MKTILILLFSFVISNSCNEQKTQDMENTVLEYEFYSRGSYNKIVMDSKTIKSFNERNLSKPSAEKKITATDLKIMLNLYSKLNLSTISTLKSPTQKRFYDGAPIAVFIVKTPKGNYQSPEFDHEEAPSEIKQIVDKMNQIAQN
jgi:hypothetical protein